MAVALLAGRAFAHRFHLVLAARLALGVVVMPVACGQPKAGYA